MASRRPPRPLPARHIRARVPDAGFAHYCRWQMRCGVEFGDYLLLIELRNDVHDDALVDGGWIRARITAAVKRVGGAAENGLGGLAGGRYAGP